MFLTDALSLKNEEKAVISIVGAGGKTTTLFLLSAELALKGKKVLVTTSTKLLMPERHQYQQIYYINTIGDILKIKIKSGTVTLLSDYHDSTSNKLVGLDPFLIDKIAENCIFDYILVEADGSQGKPLKTPAEHEPVIPHCSNIVIAVSGWEAFFQKATPELIHRLDCFKKVTGQDENSLINEATFISLINHDRGMFKGTPAEAIRIWLINKVDSSQDLQLCEKAARYIFKKSKIDRVLLCSLKQKHKRVITIIKN